MPRAPKKAVWQDAYRMSFADKEARGLTCNKLLAYIDSAGLIQVGWTDVVNEKLLTCAVARSGDYIDSWQAT